MLVGHGRDDDERGLTNAVYRMRMSQGSAWSTRGLTRRRRRSVVQNVLGPRDERVVAAVSVPGPVDRLPVSVEE